jgi:hypothetical protein
MLYTLMPGHAFSMSDIRERMVWAAAEALRPIVKRMLLMGVPFGPLELGLRELFVRVAEAQLAPSPTDSAIALVTGINRKEVKRIRAARTGNAPRSFSINQATALISRWMSDPATTDRRGKPLPLPYPKFMRLARKLTGDLAPGVLLNELLRSGAAEMRDKDTVVLRTDAYVPKIETSGLTILGEDAAELAETILRNVFSEGAERLLQRKIFYDNLGTDAAARVRSEMRREGERFLRRIDRLLSRYDRDRNPDAPGGERHYAAMGVYFFENPSAPARASRPNRPATRKASRRRKSR